MNTPQDIDLQLVAAIGKRGELGYENNLAWHLPSDLKHFKKLTSGSVMIMGRKTFDSLPGLLPGREHIVLSSQKKERSSPNSQVYYVQDLQQLFTLLKESFAQKKLFVIGGAQIYDLLFPYVTKAFITHVQAQVQADCFFPLHHLDSFKNQECWEVSPDQKDQFDYKIVSYSK